MPDFKEPRGVETRMLSRVGGDLHVGYDGPPGEALHVRIGIEDLQHGDVLFREFEPDQITDMGNTLLEMAQAIRDGK